MFLADPSDVALRASSDDPVLHTMRNPLRGISEQVAGLSDPRNHVFRVSIPSFWIGLILLSIFGVQLRWINVAGGTTDFKAMILPSVTLALSMSAKYTRQVRNAVLEELRQDYVIGARMRGIKESVILWRHVLPNAMLPIVTLLGLSLGSLLGGTAVVEIIYNWPGMGSMAIKAIACRDYPMVQAYVLMIAIMYMVINIIVDLSYTYLDPRIKEVK